MTNIPDTRRPFVTAEDVREAETVVRQFAEQVSRAANEVDRHPGDNNVWNAYRRVHDEWWQAQAVACYARHDYHERTGIPIRSEAGSR
jgi:hypothetical protein